jgi:hypothetical protein
MNMGTIWTVLGVIVWAFKLLIVLVVAAIVFAVLRSVFAKKN